MDELQKAIKTARDVHDRSEELTRTSVALGALIRAVELLAETKRCQCQWEAGDSLCDMHGQDEPESVSHPNGLIQIVANMVHARTSSTMIACQDFARAILAELAKTTVALPTDEEISNALHVEPGHSATIVANLFRDRVAPIIAAKDARLETERDAAKTRVAELESAAAEAIAT